jgi:hypothetical protein
MSKEVIIETAVAVATKLCGSEEFKSFTLGTYNDGTARSLPDAISGETMSPNEKRKAEKAKQKFKKKKKKNKERAKLKL